MEKTNVMRVLDKAKIEYKAYSYIGTGALSGEEVALALGENPEQVFKTLVTVAKSKNHYVFLIPVKEELDLKKAAAAVGEKAVEMIQQKGHPPLKGYIHGGGSPIGMKKQFKTAAKNTLLKDQRMNIRIAQRDLEGLKTKALEEGMPYQTLVASILHKYITGKLKEA